MAPCWARSACFFRPLVWTALSNGRLLPQNHWKLMRGKNSSFLSVRERFWSHTFALASLPFPSSHGPDRSLSGLGVLSCVNIRNRIHCQEFVASSCVAHLWFFSLSYCGTFRRIFSLNYPKIWVCLTHHTSITYGIRNYCTSPGVRQQMLFQYIS